MSKMTLLDARCAMEDIFAYFENLSDVNDGDYGEPEPNKEMKLCQQAQEVLDLLETLDV